VLWYLGDEINHKPDQHAPFPEGFKYDYCNPDVLINRLTVRDGMIYTPEGIRYRVLWLPDNQRMLPQTLEKLHALIRDGAIIIGDAPHGLATLTDATVAQQRFDAAVRNIWGSPTPALPKGEGGIRKVGKGAVVSGMTLAEALNELNIEPDVTGGDALWTHRSVDGADWYYVTAPQGSDFAGTLNFRSTGNVEIWCPLTGTIEAAEAFRNSDRTYVTLDLPQAGSCFVVFRNKGGRRHCGLDPQSPVNNGMLNQVQHDAQRLLPLATPWTISFPAGWGASSSLQISELKAWEDLDVSDEARAFSGSAIYTTTFDVGEIKPEMRFSLDLGHVEMIAAVSLNGKPLRTLCMPPYRLDITETVQAGINTLTIEVTSTWFNRLVYDANQPEDQRKTWTISGPAKDEALRKSGLLGPVVLTVEKK
jgi:hypothetical protein